MAPSVAAPVYQLPDVEIIPVPCGVMFTVPTEVVLVPTVVKVILPLAPDAKAVSYTHLTLPTILRV